MEKVGLDKIQILDCTLRDGGLGLEDAFKNGIDIDGFSEIQREQIALNLQEAGIDIVELGSIEKSERDNRRFCIYHNIEEISKIIPKQRNENQLFAALYRGPDTPLGDIPEWKEGLCKVVRVILRYSELEKSIEFCETLSKKGYLVFVQPMLTMRYTKEELEYILNSANKMKAYAVYFVDSYGYMTNNDVKYFFEKYDEMLASDIKIGFHSHNNMSLAFSNVLYMQEICSSRQIIVDSCIMGMGQGAGNVQTELLIGYIKEQLHSKYKFGSILDACEIIEDIYKPELWGYSVTRLLPALHKLAYKYSLALRKKYNLSYKEIDELLGNITDDVKHRYTEKDLERLIVSRIEK